jgi:hypothetical chaperone protein
MFGIGIDYGTSNCAVATYDGQTIRHADLENGRPAPEIMPSALYLEREGSFEVGRAAIEAYVTDNAGRTVRLSAERVGEISVTVAGTDATGGHDDGAITDEFEVHAFTDQEMPGRLFRGVKRWLGNPSVESVRVFDSRYRIVALVTPLLARLAESSIAAAGGTAGRTVVGRPVHWEGSKSGRDGVALTRMTEACRHAGLPGASFFEEPSAAALSFLHGARATRDGSERVVLAFDFGGGTLDLCVMRARRTTFDVLATHGIGLGGDEIDRRIFRAKLFPELGEGTSVGALGGSGMRTIPFPFRDCADRLLNWMQAHELNRPEILEMIANGARQPGTDGEKIERLGALIRGNYVFTAFQAIEKSKIALSSKPRTSIEVPEIDLAVAIERTELEALLAPLLDEIERCIERVLEAAGLSAASIDVVIRTGGSSRIPVIGRLLEDRFPGRVVEHGAFTSIAAGLAIASHHAAVAA